ncbi:hypothetical protein [Halorarius litoreus]|uniref:hypothetical protein n=1 Tax=Halorarius litoreus TaxID=2962676 RepID=UPI0020CE191D|nr:hypothetical protein [Halorarius litoreus]
MGDTKAGRERQALKAERQQRDRELQEALARVEEAEPALDEGPRICHYRGCTELATFLVVERYLEETGHGSVTAEAAMCQAHADDESPTNLDHAYSGYLFKVEPLPALFELDEE